jgi:Flp pilus assembly protein TadG
MLSELRKSVRRAARNEDGNVTVEFVILFPTLLLVLGILMDVAFMYYGQSQVLATIQKANRDRAIGNHLTDAETKGSIELALSKTLSDEAVADVSVTAGILHTSVRVPSHDLQLVGFFAGLAGDPVLTVVADQVIENWEGPDGVDASTAPTTSLEETTGLNNTTSG